MKYIFNNNKFSGDETKVNNFIEEMKILNHEEHFHIERARLEEQISQNETVRKAGVGMIMELYDEWYSEFLEEWDEVLQRCVIAAIKKRAYK